MISTKKLIIPLVILSTAVIAGCAGSGKGGSGNNSSSVGIILGAGSGNSVLGNMLGSTIGSIGKEPKENQMDRQALEMQALLKDALIERTGNNIIVEFNNKHILDVKRNQIAEFAKPSLANLIIILQKYRDTNIELQAYTDNKGMMASNIKVSQRHADVIYKYLVANNQIESSRIRIRAFGEDSSKYSNETNAGRLQNQRIAFVISEQTK